MPTQSYVGKHPISKRIGRAIRKFRVLPPRHMLLTQWRVWPNFVVGGERAIQTWLRGRLLSRFFFAIAMMRVTSKTRIWPRLLTQPKMIRSGQVAL
jgi:hypothetical protein